jgi:hypothetical protein
MVLRLLSHVAHLVLVVPLTTATICSTARGTVLTVPETESSADDNDRELELLAPAAARQALRPNAIAARSVPTARPADLRAEPPLHPVRAQNSFSDPLGTRLRC